MPLTYTGTTIGKIVIKQKIGDYPERRFTIQIRTGNCLAVLLHIRRLTEEELKEHPAGKWMHSLYSFFGDEQHLKNMLKEYGKVLFDDVVSIRLNMFYKENKTLLKYFLKSGYEVRCYYKEEEQ